MNLFSVSHWRFTICFCICPRKYHPNRPHGWSMCAYFFHRHQMQDWTGTALAEALAKRHTMPSFIPIQNQYMDRQWNSRVSTRLVLLPLHGAIDWYHMWWIDRHSYVWWIDLHSYLSIYCEIIAYMATYGEIISYIAIYCEMIYITTYGEIDYIAVIYHELIAYIVLYICWNDCLHS